MSGVWPGPDDFEAYCAPPQAVPPPTESELVEKAIADRRMQGLPVDDGSVRRAIENCQRPDYRWRGMFFTPEEQAEIESVDPTELPVSAQGLVTDAGGVIGQIKWCWLDGRRGVEVSVKDDVDRYRALLNRELGPERVIVTKARYAEHELDELRDRIRHDVSELRELGIDVSSFYSGQTGVSVQFFAVDRDRAEAQFAERYGPDVIPGWLGPASMAEEPQTFGSWIADGDRLTVFYPLPHNGETPGMCTAQELPGRVIVALTLLAPQGRRTAMGGILPSHATIELAEPLGDRVVIDAAENVERRPHTSCYRSAIHAERDRRFGREAVDRMIGVVSREDVDSRGAVPAWWKRQGAPPALSTATSYYSVLLGRCGRGRGEDLAVAIPRCGRGVHDGLSHLLVQSGEGTRRSFLRGRAGRMD